MATLRPYVWASLIVVAIAAATSLSYWLGYRSGVDASNQKWWAVVTKQKRPDGTISGSSYSWFNLNDPADVAKLGKEEARLKAAGVEFYLHEGEVESTLFLKPDPVHADSVR